MPTTPNNDALKGAVKDALTDAVAEAMESEDGTFAGDDDATDEISATDALLAQVRGDQEATVNIHRIGAGRGKEPFLYSAAPDDVTATDIMERCQAEFGGGDFKMVIRDAQKIVNSARFSVESPKTSDEPVQAKEEFGAAALIAVMQQSNAQMMTMFQSTMGTMAEAMKGGNQPAFSPTEATKTIMESVAAMKHLSDPPKDTSGADLIKTLLQGFEMAKGFVQKDGDTNSYDLLSKAIDFLPSLADASRNAPQAPPGPGAPPLDPEGQAAVNREHAMHREKVTWQMNVTMLVGWAKAGKDPALYAEFILDQMGEEKVLQFIAAPDALQKLASFNAEVLHFAPWFEALKAEILGLTDQDQEGDTAIEGELEPAGDSNAVSEPDNHDGNLATPPGRNGGDT